MSFSIKNTHLWIKYTIYIVIVARREILHDDTAVILTFDTSCDIVGSHNSSGTLVSAVQTDDQHAGVPWVQLSHKLVSIDDRRV